jgi:hypothetical protein
MLYDGVGINNPSGKLTTTIYPESYANGEPMSGAFFENVCMYSHFA